VPEYVVRAALEIETGITGAGFALRRRGRRADGPQNQPKYIQAYLMCRQRTRISARARTMRPFACEYGARGAALFDIVNVQIWTRRRARRTDTVASTPGAAPRPFLPICRMLA
jgi:hypothetical protein